MIVEKELDTETLGQLTGTEIDMDFDPAAIGQLMDNMAKHLYADPKRAIVREYSTNGWDATVEAVKNGAEARAMEITLPTDLNPVLSIRDFGVGLDFDGIATVYSRYGASTKRDSNEYNGTFGIGGKSAFAYSNRFTVVSIKNGRRIEVVVTRSDDGRAKMIVVGSQEGTPTDEPSGTQIKIPTKRGDDLVAEAEAVYRWFEPGSVLVNGETPKHFDPQALDVLEIATGIFVAKNPETKNQWGSIQRQERDDLIVMGNVAYPTRFKSGLARDRFHVVAFVPLGAVAIPSSREKLIDDSKLTQATLAHITETLRAELPVALQRHIEAADNRWDAADLLARWRNVVPNGTWPQDGFKYDGELIPTEVAKLQGEPNIRLLPYERGTSKHNSHQKLRKLSMRKFARSLWVEGYVAESVSPAQAQKARAYVHTQSIDASNGIVLIDTIPTEVRPWIETVVPYETIKAIKLPKDPNAKHHVQTNSGRIPGSYDLFTTELSVRPNPTGKHIAKTGVPAETFRHWTVPLFYAIGSQSDIKYLTAGLDAVCANGYTLVALYQSRVEKFKRNFPAAQEAREVITKGWERWGANEGKDVPLGLALQGSWSHRNLKLLDESQIDDPELSKWVRLSKTDLTASEASSKVFTRVLGKEITHGALPDLHTLYPLLDTSEPEHSHIYVNAIYAARQAATL